MHTLAVVGSQWGDEGKGKITDLLSKECDIVVRYQGGNNAGHTIIVEGKKIVLHLIPSGVLHPHCVSVIGHGVVVDLQALVDEIQTLKKTLPFDIDQNNLMLSENCPVITMYHKLLDQVREGMGPQKIGTTGRGIGPCYEDKIGRRCLKIKDLFDKKKIKSTLEKILHEKQILFKELYKTSIPPIDEETERLYKLGKELSKFIGNSFSYIADSISNNKKILYEGAQGLLLDVDYGTYPYVTSSNTSIGGIATGAFFPDDKINEIIGITKAYMTRVGEGPFPTELSDQTGEKLQQKGLEFGATTGRRRRCGWLDLPLLKYAVKAGKITSLALTKLDVLSGIDIKICHSYLCNGKTIDCAYPGIDFSKVKPLYKNFPSFKDDFDLSSSNKNDYLLSDNLKDYIKIIENHVKIPVGILAFGPEREQIIFRKNYFVN